MEHHRKSEVFPVVFRLFRQVFHQRTWYAHHMRNPVDALTWMMFTREGLAVFRVFRAVALCFLAFVFGYWMA